MTMRTYCLELRGVQSKQNTHVVPVGYLEAKGLAPSETIDETGVPTDQQLENRGRMPTNRPTTASMNIMQRLMMQAGRKRTLSLGG